MASADDLIDFGEGTSSIVPDTNTIPTSTNLESTLYKVEDSDAAITSANLDQITAGPSNFTPKFHVTELKAKVPKHFISNYKAQVQFTQSLRDNYYKTKAINLNSHSDIDIQSQYPNYQSDSFSDYVVIIEKQVVKDNVKEGVDEDKVKEIINSLIAVDFLVEIVDDKRFGQDKIALFLTVSVRKVQELRIKELQSDYLLGLPISEEDLLNEVKHPNNIKVSVSDRLRLVYDLITHPTSELGAGLNQGEDGIHSIYPVHDRAFNRWFIKYLSKAVILTDSDLDILRYHCGEELTLYFGFLQFYQLSLIPIGVLGFISRFVLGYGYYFQAILMLLWGGLFVLSWNIKERELSHRWNLNGCSQLEHIRKSFKPEFFVKNTINQRLEGKVRWTSRLQLKLQGYGWLLSGAVILLAMVLFSFCVEIILNEFYYGPFKMFLGLIPPIIYALSVGNSSKWFIQLARDLTNRENHDTQTNFMNSITRKVFTVNSLVNYASILFVSWIYIPLGNQIFHWIHPFLHDGPVEHELVLGVGRLQTQINYFMVMKQLIGMVTETFVPFGLRYYKRYDKQIKAKIFGKKVEDVNLEPKKEVVKKDLKEGQIDYDHELLKFIQEFNELGDYDMYEDYAEMVVQFGHVTMFSVVFPLAGIISMINNFVELRTDALKIFFTARRLVPVRSEGIGAWKNHLYNLLWVSSMINGLLIYQFTHNMTPPTASRNTWIHWGLTALIWERFFQWGFNRLRKVFDSVPHSWDVRKSKLEFKRRETLMSSLDLKKLI